MPRKKQQPANMASDIHADPAGLQGVTDAADQHHAMLDARATQLAAIDARLGLDVPYDYETYIAAGRDSVAVMGERLFVIGRICIAIKEHEPHGRFGEALDRIGVKPRFAQTCMQAAIKYLGSDSRKLIAGRLASTKLLELVSEADDDLDLLGEGGTLADLTLDDIDKMSVRELKDALRKERKSATDELAARDEIIERKDKKLRDLELKTRKAGKLPVREKGEELLQLALSRLGTAVAALQDLELAVDEIHAVHLEADEPLPKDLVDQLDHVANTCMARAREIEESCNR